MAYDEAIAAGVTNWLSSNEEAVTAALAKGADTAAQLIALRVAKSVDAWFAENKDELINAIAQQIAAQNRKPLDFGDGRS